MFPPPRQFCALWITKWLGYWTGSRRLVLRTFRRTLNTSEPIKLYVYLYIVKTSVFFVVCHQKAEPAKCLQPRAASCWTGSPALVPAEAPQYCHLQGVMGGRGWFAIHRHGLLRRRWSVPKAQGAERAASAWKSGGGVVCSDRHGSAGTVQTHSIYLLQGDREWQVDFREILPQMCTWKKCIFLKIHLWSRLSCSCCSIRECLNEWYPYWSRHAFHV